jgi:CubicO group peptidase (beta-lactamase class C family)
MSTCFELGRSQSPFFNDLLCSDRRIRLGGAASTHFWNSPTHELAVVVLTQYMPFSPLVADAVKPIVYGAILDGQ